jgi:hypothetical protein
MTELDRLRALAPWDWPDNAKDIILRALDAGSSEQRAALKLAGNTVVVDDELAERLLALVTSDADEAVRGEAAIALGPALEDFDTTDGDDAYGDGPALSEQQFRAIGAALRRIHDDPAASKLVRRRALEASIRAPAEWHEAAIVAAYQSDDPDWRLTAVFAMGFVPGFEREIVEALGSGSQDLVLQGVDAASRQGVAEAGETVLRFARSSKGNRDLRLAAVGALANIEVDGRRDLLIEISHSRDQELAEVASEALAEIDLSESYDGDDDDLN